MKIVILSHGNLADALAESSRFIINEAEAPLSLCLDESGIETFSKKLKKLLDSLTGEHVLFLCDLNHGSPHNQLMLELLEYQGKMEWAIVTGVNLPMLLQAQTMQEDELSVVCEECKKAGMEGVES